MAQRKSLAAEVQILREELDALKSERGTRGSSKKTEEPSSSKSKSQDDLADQASAIEQTLKEFAEVGEKELANRPFATAGVAFLLGFLAGRASKG